MHIALFGATGGTGYQITLQALAEGHLVTALVRGRSNLGVEHPHLKVVAGDVLNAEDVTRTVAGADAVIVSLGKTAHNPENVVSQGTDNIISAMQSHGPRRLVVITSLGVGDSRKQVPLSFRLIAATALRGVMRDKQKQEELVRTSDLDWTIVRPGGLTDAPATGDYVAGVDQSIVAGQVARADVAAFVLKQLQDKTYLNATPAIT